MEISAEVREIVAKNEMQEKRNNTIKILLTTLSTKISFQTNYY